jgi:tyrosine-protein phosphatase YwqE
MSEMITREFQARLDTLEERTIVGLAVPYGQEIELMGNMKERFEPGAIDGVEDVKLFTVTKSQSVKLSKAATPQKGMRSLLESQILLEATKFTHYFRTMF